MRETGPAAKRLFGQGSPAKYVAEARVLLGQMKQHMEIHGIPSLWWGPKRYAGGITITVGATFGRDYLIINAPELGGEVVVGPDVYSGLAVWNPSLWQDNLITHPGVEGSRYFGRNCDGKFNLSNYCKCENRIGWDAVPTPLNAVSSAVGNETLDILLALEVEPNYIDLRASGKFTGKMREVVQLLAGAGERIPWRYHWHISHGIYTDAEGGDWVVEISEEDGVRVQKLEYIEFAKDDCAETTSIPVPGSGWHLVLAPSALSAFYNKLKFYTSQGWAFDFVDGGTARNTCYEYIFTGVGTEGNWHSYMYELTISGGGDPDSPSFSASLSLEEDDLFYVFYTLGADPPVPKFGSYFFPAVTETAPPLAPWWPGELYDQVLPGLGEYNAPFFVYHNGDAWEVGYWTTLIVEDPEPNETLPQLNCSVPTRSRDYGKTIIHWGVGTTVGSASGPAQSSLDLQPKAVHYFAEKRTYSYWMEAVGANLLNVNVGGGANGFVHDYGPAQRLYWRRLVEEDGTFIASTNIGIPGGDRETMFGLGVEKTTPTAEGTLDSGWVMGAIKVAGAYGQKQFLGGDCVSGGNISTTGGCASDRYPWTIGGAPHPSDPSIDMQIECSSWYIGDACLGLYCQCFSWERQSYSPLGVCGLCRYAVVYDGEPVDPEETETREMHLIASNGVDEAITIGTPTVPDDSLGYSTMLRDAFEPDSRWLAYAGQEEIIAPGGNDEYVVAFQEHYPEWEDLYGIRACFVGRP